MSQSEVEPVQYVFTLCVVNFANKKDPSPSLKKKNPPSKPPKKLSPTPPTAKSPTTTKKPDCVMSLRTCPSLPGWSP